MQPSRANSSECRPTPHGISSTRIGGSIPASASTCSTCIGAISQARGWNSTSEVASHHSSSSCHVFERGFLLCVGAEQSYLYTIQAEAEDGNTRRAAPTGAALVLSGYVFDGADATWRSRRRASRG